jgi:hypothetical protein
MSKPRLRDISQQNQPVTSEAQQRDLPTGECPRADVEMTRVLKTAPLRMASDSSTSAITFWRHDPLHDVVRPIADHIIMNMPCDHTTTDGTEIYHNDWRTAQRPKRDSEPSAKKHRHESRSNQKEVTR